MRTNRPLAAALAAAVAATPVFAQEGRSGLRSVPTPEAADRTLGMALMSAIVDIDGNLLGGAGAVGAERVSGVYRVIFNRSVQGCAFVAGQTDQPSAPALTPILAAAAHQGAIDNQVIVAFSTTEFEFEDRPFRLIVFCAQ